MLFDEDNYPYGYIFEDDKSGIETVFKCDLGVISDKISWLIAEGIKNDQAVFDGNKLYIHVNLLSAIMFELQNVCPKSFMLYFMQRMAPNAYFEVYPELRPSDRSEIDVIYFKEKGG